MNDPPKAQEFSQTQETVIKSLIVKITCFPKFLTDREVPFNFEVVSITS